MCLSKVQWGIEERCLWRLCRLEARILKVILSGILSQCRSTRRGVIGVRRPSTINEPRRYVHDCLKGVEIPTTGIDQNQIAVIELWEDELDYEGHENFMWYKWFSFFEDKELGITARGNPTNVRTHRQWCIPKLLSSLFELVDICRFHSASV